MSIFDLWFVLATIGFFYFIYVVVTSAVKTSMLGSSYNVMEVAIFISFISLTCYLASKVKFSKHNPAKWLMIQTLFGLGGFLWYYTMFYRRTLLVKATNV